MGLSKKIGNRLVALRRAAGLSKRQVAKRAKLSRSRVAKMERGRKADPRASTLLALAGALGVKPARLIEGSTPQSDAPLTPKGEKGKKAKKSKKGKKAAALAGFGDGNADVSG